MHFHTFCPERQVNHTSLCSDTKCPFSFQTVQLYFQRATCPWFFRQKPNFVNPNIQHMHIKKNPIYCATCMLRINICPQPIYE